MATRKPKASAWESELVAEIARLEKIVRAHPDLIQAPFPVFAYVVAHEVAHLRVRNHSEAFWAMLAGIVPEARGLDAALRVWGSGRREL